MKCLEMTSLIAVEHNMGTSRSTKGRGKEAPESECLLLLEEAKIRFSEREEYGPRVKAEKTFQGI